MLSSSCERWAASLVTSLRAKLPKNYESGDDATGLAIIRRWLERNGIATGSLALHDGSGLSRLDLVSPAATVGLLRAIAKRPAAAVFRESLPVAGTDGTLGSRLVPYRNRIFAKTGYITYDNSLSGYLISAEGEDLAFSIMSNDQTHRGSSIRLIDVLAGILAEYSPGKPLKTLKAP